MGIARSIPISNLHIQRSSVPLFNAAVCEIQGFRDTQEDAHNIVSNVNEKGLMLFGIYDGHGGSLCSKYLSQELPAAFSKLESLDDKQAITDICINVDRQFLDCGKMDGSTCCVVLAQLYKREGDIAITDMDEYLASIDNDQQTFEKETHIKVVSVNIGDSRAVILKRLALFPDVDLGTGQPCDDEETYEDSAYFQPITVDHKPTNQLELRRIMMAGGFVEMGRVDGSLALSRAFGDSAYKVPQDFPPENQKVSVVPDLQYHYIDWGDALFLSCDGIFEVDSMTYSEVAQELVLSIIKSSKMQNEIEVKERKEAEKKKKEEEEQENGVEGGEKTPSSEESQEDTATPKSDDEEKDKDTAMEDATQKDVEEDKEMKEVKEDENKNDLFNPQEKRLVMSANGKKQLLVPTDNQLYNFDPAIACRDVISRSLDAGSKDNHTALVVSFKPPMFFTPSIVNLPNHEVIPAPFSVHAHERSFDSDYVSDLGTFGSNDLRHLILELDAVWEKHRFSQDPNCVAEIKQTLAARHHSTVLPIVYGNGSIHQRQQQHQQQHYQMQHYNGMASHYANGYEDDDDDDDEYGHM